MGDLEQLDDMLKEETHDMSLSSCKQQLCNRVIYDEAKLTSLLCQTELTSNEIISLSLSDMTIFDLVIF